MESFISNVRFCSMANGQGEKAFLPPPPKKCFISHQPFVRGSVETLYPISELSPENNYLLWGLQTVIPGSLQARLFTERHENHLVTAKAPVAPLQGRTVLESVAASAVSKYKNSNSHSNLLSVVILYCMKWLVGFFVSNLFIF